MVTINQLLRKARLKKRNKKISPLSSKPFTKGIVNKVLVFKPRKPNSAKRSVVRVSLANDKILYAYIPGEGHNLQEHSNVLIRGGGPKDLPGIDLSVVRGTLDTQGVSREKRSSSRSRYGTKKD